MLHQAAIEDGTNSKVFNTDFSEEFVRRSCIDAKTSLHVLRFLTGLGGIGSGC
jgi:hypothetical protein